MAVEQRKCLSCGYTGDMKTWLSNYNGPQFIAILLLLAYIIPGVIFIAWGWKKFKCPKCGALAKNVAFTDATPLQGAKTKKCPLCAEEIKPEAVKCRYCGSDVPTYAENAPVGPASPIPVTPVKKPISKIVKIGGGILLLFFVIGVIGALFAPKTPSTPPVSSEPKGSTTFPGGTYKVVWKQGLILGLLAPSNTTQPQLEELIYKFRKAKKDKTLSSMIPPVNLGLTDKYTAFIIFVFSDPKWATVEAYKIYERSGAESATAKEYLNHMVASYQYDIDGKEYGEIGHSDGLIKSRNYRKLF